MEKRPVKFDLFEWLILTDLVKADREKYQDKDHKGSDVYNISKLNADCASQVMLDGTTEDARRRALVAKLKEYEDEGYRYIEFRPFEDQEDAMD